MATTIDSVTTEVTDTAPAEAFHTRAFDVADRVLVGASQAPSTDFRGFTSSLVVSPARQDRRRPGRQYRIAPTPDPRKR